MYKALQSVQGERQLNGSPQRIEIGYAHFRPRSAAWLIMQPCDCSARVAHRD